MTSSVPSSPTETHGLEVWRDLVDSHHLTLGDALIAIRICRMCAEPPDSSAALALVLAIRAVREGSTALDVHSAVAWLGEQDDDVAAQEGAPTTPRLDEVRELPSPQDWLAAVSRSQLAARGVLHVDLDLVYLDRYYCDETSIAERLLRRDAVPPSPAGEPVAGTAWSSTNLNEAQRAAVNSVLTRTTTVLTGGPGMGKTHTIGGVLTAVRAAHGDDFRIALAAPTGKAAARMSESLTDQGIALPEPATTLHRLLGPVFGTSQRFRHDRHNPLPHDLVVVDEASMISLTMMARLLEALPDTTRLLLVGDPDQLESVEAGSVLRDVAEGLGPEGGVVQLSEEFRLSTRRADLARAFRTGDADAVVALLEEGAMTRHTAGITHPDEPGDPSLSAEVRFIDPEASGHGGAGTSGPDHVPDLTEVPEVLAHAERLRELALAGQQQETITELGTARLLCAHRTGPYSTRRWNRLIEQALAERWPDIAHQEMYVGRPLLVTRNDYGLGLTNGDTGVVIRRGDHLITAFTTDDGAGEDMSPWRLADVETMHAMTVHKAQGSQADHITVIVPPVGSRLLTREMLYTAVTRAQRTLTVVGTAEAVRSAVRSPARRSSGLGRRLQAGATAAREARS